MYKVMIVDDEAIEREALHRIIHGAYGALCQIETAANGKAAIALAETLRPDIVIMDIEMPGINGLEAAATIKEMLPRCRVIIVTAYDRFQYAQAAVSLGVEEYLLKPVANADLFRLLERAMLDIDEGRRDSARRTALDQLAKEQFVLSVISGFSSVASLQSQLRELGLPFSHGFFGVIRSTRRDGAERVAALVGPHLARTPDVQVLLYEYDDSLLVVALMDAVYLTDEDILRASETAMEAVRREHDMPLYIGVSHIVTDLGDLQDAYHAATEAAALCTPGQPIRFPVEGVAREPDQQGLERKLYGFLLEKDLAAALHCVETMLDTLDFCLRDAAAARQALCRLVGRVGERLREDVGLDSDMIGGARGLGDGNPSRQELALRVRALLLSWIQALDEQPPARIQRIRGEIERYLRGHFAEDLSIRQVARAMHYSEPYFSKLFSRCFHKNFVTYLTDIRMQAARDMLAGSEESVREVSSAVGFADANYFAKVFRKAYGISPTEYRRLAFARQGGEATPE